MLREDAAGGPALPLGPVRGMVLLLFAAFAGLHWMWLLDPAASGRAWEAVGIVVLVVLGLLGAARLPGALRHVAAALIAVAAVALALAAGGVADEDLRPDRWGELLAGVGRGIEALPGVRVPYRGLDESVRMVIGAGGTLLAVVAALLAFWPRRDGTGFPAAALLALVTLYAVPAVVLDFEGEFLRGALLALLMVAFLRLEKLRVRDAPAAGIVAVAAAIAALMAAPLLDSREPWWDYESWAIETAGARAVAFDWDHDYSPLDWPRDGRELLRVKARLPAYWKAMDLDVFDGLTWRHDPRNSTARPSSQLPDSVSSRERWTQEIEVTLRNLRTDSFITAGIATDVQGEDGFPIGGGLFGAVRSLGRGDSYEADVYTPQPTERQLRDRRQPTTRTGCGRTPRCSCPSASAGPTATAASGSRSGSAGRCSAPRACPDRRGGRRRGAAGERADRGERRRPLPGASPRSSGRAPRRRSSTSSASRPTSTTDSPTPSGRRRPRGRSTASCSTPRSASASSSPGPRRCCCGWAACLRAWRPDSRRAPSTTSRRSTSSATSTRTRGSRSGSPATAG